MPRNHFLVDQTGQDVLLTRQIQAPPELVFRACTEAELLVQWWGPEKLTTVVERLEAWPGGRWRFVQRDRRGSEYAFHGVYHTVAAPRQLIYTFEYEGSPGHVLLETLTFTAQDGGTLLADQSVFQSVEDRDKMLAAGMEAGAFESMERLAALLTRLQAGGM